jgi:hypothetical protein
MLIKLCTCNTTTYGNRKVTVLQYIKKSDFISISEKGSQYYTGKTKRKGSIIQKDNRKECACKNQVVILIRPPSSWQNSMVGSVNPLKQHSTHSNTSHNLNLATHSSSAKRKAKPEKQKSRQSTARRAVRDQPQWEGRGWKAGKVRKIKAKKTL